MDESKKILIVCPASRDIITFRKNLIFLLREKQYKVSTIAFDEEYRNEIEDLGVDHYVVKDDNRGLNPIKILSLESRYKKIIKKISPKIVFTFELKPNIFAVKAANSLNIEKIFSMVEGGGDVFGQSGFKWFIIRNVVCKLLKVALKYSQKVFFINYDDKSEFINRKIVKEKQTEVIPGVGIDIEYFSYKPICNYNKFLMVSRMIKAKGVFDYCKAARIVKKNYPNAIFNYLGGEGTVKIADIQEFLDDGSINYLGTTKDVRTYYEDCSVQVLPTYYREGLVLVNVEAGAVGRPTITCNVIGAKDTVKDGYNGFFVKPQDPQDLAEKMIYFLENPQKIIEMGLNNRKFVEEKFEQKKINNYIINVIENSLEHME